MFLDIIRAIILGAFPVAIFTFLTLQWAISSGRLDKFSNNKGLKEQFKKISAAKKAAKKKGKEAKASNASNETSGENTAGATDKKTFFHKNWRGDFFHEKIMFFGGGFYGTMALFTYAIIEISEIFNFVGKIIDFTTWTFRFSIDFIITFLINSIMNIVKAFIWFITLEDYVDMKEGFIWLVAAYIGYLAGVRFTHEKGETVWVYMANAISKFKKSP